MWARPLPAEHYQIFSYRADAEFPVCTVAQNAAGLKIPYSKLQGIFDRNALKLVWRIIAIGVVNAEKFSRNIRPLLRPCSYPLAVDKKY